MFKYDTTNTLPAHQAASAASERAARRILAVLLPALAAAIVVLCIIGPADRLHLSDPAPVQPISCTTDLDCAHQDAAAGRTPTAVLSQQDNGDVSYVCPAGWAVVPGLGWPQCGLADGERPA